MTKRDPLKRRLLVEGKSDLRVIPELVKRGTGLRWELGKPKHLVEIVSADGLQNLLDPDFVTTQLVSPGDLGSLGLIVDADSSCNSRWHSLRGVLSPHFPQLPRELPPQGLVNTRADDLRLGVWIMPDNQSAGMMETFLSYLVPNRETSDLYHEVIHSVERAREKGAPFKDCHQDKALIHTWLAWQDEPGYQLHTAVMKGALEVHSSLGIRFIEWFCEVFRLETPAPPPVQVK